MLREASAFGRKSFLTQQLLATGHLVGVEGAAEIQDNPDDMLAIELSFMWGWSFAYAEGRGGWPTTPDQRATLQMIQYCMDHHSMDLEQARAEGSALDRMWNEVDPLFDALQKRGQESFHDPDQPILAYAIERIAQYRQENPTAR
ncbi:hypothetical protein EAT49_10640 [Histidinibacterium lentulum]|uniref:Uncharacterized protein n=2 Tax=Histidinibacterium lentulum TaxID=2480588 RepID=A0A3N2R5J7_9RHOB|nr:hypothetical protein EAT49_10640 [Histidinibacterium lentulum]